MASPVNIIAFWQPPAGRAYGFWLIFGMVATLTVEAPGHPILHLEGPSDEGGGQIPVLHIPVTKPS
jgi:hypothetical protein